MHIRRATFFVVRLAGVALVLLALLVACGGSALPAEQATTVPPVVSASPSASATSNATPTIAVSTPSVATSAVAATTAATESVTVSADQIAFVKQSHIWLLDLASGDSWQLTTDGENSDPAWSPDGQMLAFTRLYDGNPEIATIHADGSGLTRITDHPANDLHPAYARDGTLFYARHQQDENSAIELIRRDAAGKEQVVYTQPGGLCAPVHLSAADPGRLALSLDCGRGSNALLIDPANNSATDMSLDYAPNACVYQATFAHTQPRLALLTAEDCSPQLNSGIATLNLDDPSPALEARYTSQEIWAVAWSADDQALVFQKNSDSDPALSGLWLLPLAGESSTPRQLTTEGISPAWRP